jgi:hypothetical protein
MDEALFYFGDTLKALDNNGRVGGYALRFTDREHRDLQGTYFTKDTYLGAHQGDGVDVLFHHGQSLHTSRRMTDEQKQAFQKFSDHIFSPAKTKRDEVGLFTEVVLDMADEYERAIFGLVKAGKLGWSSGSTWHMVKATDDGEITRWPIIEISMTPQPAEPLNRAVTLKAIESLKFIPLDDDADDDDFDDKPMTEEEKLVSSFKSLDIDLHSRLAVSALTDLASRFHVQHEARLKTGRVISEKNRRRIASLLERLLEQESAVSADLRSLLEDSTGAMTDTKNRAKETERFMAKYRYDRR